MKDVAGVAVGLAERLSLCHGTMDEVAAPDFVEAAAAAGFRRVSLRVHMPRLETASMGASSARGTDELWRETKRRLDATGLRVIEAEAAVLLPGGDLAQWRRYLHTAADLRAEGVTPCFFGAWAPAALHDAFAGFLAMADEYHLRVLIEPIALSRIPNLETAVAQIRRFQGRGLGLIVDMLHLARSGGTPAQVAALAQVAPALFFSAQINDGPLPYPFDGRNWWHEMSNARRFLGSGDFPVRELAAALPPRIPIGLEICFAPWRHYRLTAREKAVLVRNNALRYFGLAPETRLS